MLAPAHSQIARKIKIMMVGFTSLNYDLGYNFVIFSVRAMC